MSQAISRFVLRAFCLPALVLLPALAGADDQAESPSIEKALAIKISIEASDGAEQIAEQISEKSAVPVKFSPSLETLGVTK